MIQIPSTQIDRFIWKVYELSQPAGMGYLTASHKSLTDDEINQCKMLQDKFNSRRKDANGTRIYLDFDYLRGRRIKIQMWVDRNSDFWILNGWEDHTQEEFNELLEFVKASK